MPNEATREFYPEGYQSQPASANPSTEPDDEEQSQEQAPKGKGGWVWIGSSSRSAAQKGDGVSDLFRTNFDDDLEDVNDLVTVDVERDVVDAGHDGTLDDLVDVFPEDIMGVNDIGQKPSRKQLRRLRAERKARQAASESPTSVRTMRE